METKPGHWYLLDASGEAMEEVTPDQATVPDFWACRRVVDFPSHAAPSGSVIVPCNQCDEPVAFDPVADPAPGIEIAKVCMQCMGITPLSIH